MEALIALIETIIGFGQEYGVLGVIALGGVGGSYLFYKRKIRTESEFKERDTMWDQRIKELRDDFTIKLLSASNETDEYRKLHSAAIERQDRMATALEAILGVKMPK